MPKPLQLSGLEAAFGLPPRPLHLAIGMFDGVHLGHQTVVESAVHSARRRNGIAAVLTFYPHPSALFRADNPTRLLMPAEMKLSVLGDLGVEVVIQQTFTRVFASITAEDFLPRLKGFLPHLEAVYVGENWRFGQGRKGDVALLVEEGRKLGITVVSASRVNHNGEPISSTRVRGCLVEGQIATANALLGYAYFAEGEVRPGKRLGRTIGFPTLNIDWDPELPPRFGVYAVRAGRVGETDRRPGVANYGMRPTVESGAVHPRLEVHILGDCPFQAGDCLRVEWLEFIRPEQKFSGVEALRNQIAQDRETAERYFAE